MQLRLEFTSPPPTHTHQHTQSSLHALSARIDQRTSPQHDAPYEARAIELAQEVRDVLNQGQLTYIAVVKAAKKRNRHLNEAFGAGSVQPLQALGLLVRCACQTDKQLPASCVRAHAGIDSCLYMHVHAAATAVCSCIDIHTHAHTVHKRMHVCTHLP